MAASSQSLKYAEELHVVVAGQAHRETSRLRAISNKLETGVRYLVYGWAEGAWGTAHRGSDGGRDDRLMAGEFLKELVRILDATARTLLLVSPSWTATVLYTGAEIGFKNSMLLQQCTIDTKNFNEQVEIALYVCNPWDFCSRLVN